MVLDRIIEPMSKADAIRVLGEVGAPCPSLRSSFPALQRCQERDCRDLIARDCVKHSAQAGTLAAMVVYVVATVHFEANDEDKLRKVGMSRNTASIPKSKSDSWWISPDFRCSFTSSKETQLRPPT